MVHTQTYGYTIAVVAIRKSPYHLLDRLISFIGFDFFKKHSKMPFFEECSKMS